MSKNLRYLILLTILLLVAVNEVLNRTRATSWERPLWVRLYAFNGDARDATERYIDGLTTRDFVSIENFINREARRYGVDIDAIDVEYNGRLEQPPPQPPSGRNILENVWWSLKFRGWSLWRSWGSEQDSGDIELFVSYYDSAATSALPHSVGLQGGMIGIINAFADKNYHGSNEVVMAHELMHTLGATDRYDANSMPLYPSGYAEPDRQPLHPQRKAEIMGGPIPLAPGQARMPRSLGEVVVGGHTAAEIDWLGELD